jgi:hypothetical protein
LHAAKKALKHGQWIKMFEGDLKFNRFTATIFMRIAKWVSNVGNGQHFPPNYSPPDYLPPDYNTIEN